jgi:leucyl aminopeptidase (aminopeptidase T)
MDGLSGRLRVTSAAGTDITLMAERFETCRHEIADAGGLAFLPPSETSARVRGADGTIVVDVTVGQLYHYGELLEEFGLVRNPVILTVENGFVSGITGGETAALLREKLFALPAGCRELVELGQGLSKMTPTGVIGVDESIIDTCHFGFGDGGTCGTHLDVVIGSPVIAMA